MFESALNPMFTAGGGLWPVLSQVTSTARARNEILVYLLLLVGAGFVIVAIGLIARKLLGGPTEGHDADAIFDLSELRRLHREGRLTDEEFQAARAAALMDGAAGYLGAPTPKPPPAAADGSQDIELGPELLADEAGPKEPGESDKPAPDA